MKQVLIFSGTTEGRNLADYLCANSINCTVCVATEYGGLVMEKKEGLTIHQGRMTEEEMKNFISTGEFLAVVDATHPFATVVSENIRRSIFGSDLKDRNNSASEFLEGKIPYLRLKRDMAVSSPQQREINYFLNHEDCAKALEETKGNILLTTGSKDLSIYCKSKELRTRIYARVLPGLENISNCIENGIVAKQIIALQGPFSIEMNEALIRQYDISCIVTKESGANSGFMEKLQAAHNTKIKGMVISNPETIKGLTFEEVCKELGELTGCSLIKQGVTNHKRMRQKQSNRKEIDMLFDSLLKTPQNIAANSTIDVISDKTSHTSQGLLISLVGMGMGSERLLTKEAQQAITQADLIFGAKRLLEGISSSAKKVDYYLAKDIIPYLKEKVSGENHGDSIQKVAVLFSGDTGFYSGAEKLYEALQNEKKEETMVMDIKICPGISSISYLAAKLGVSWQDGKILSIHGRTMNIMEEIKSNPKIFLLMTGVDDMNKLGTMLIEEGMDTVRILAGYQLSYPEEEIMGLSPIDCIKLEKNGLYTCLIKNDCFEKKSLTHGLPDGVFIRDKVPMTKEEVREVSICKLRLHKNAILYDIGSGTGSIAVEGARLSRSIQVYAVEKKKDGAQLIKHNCELFHLQNITIIQGEAPDAIYDLPVPTHAFVGGSGGNMKEILTTLYGKNQRLRVVINAITLETIGEVTKLLEQLPVENAEMIQLQLSRSHKAGGYHLMKAENPVYIISFNFKESKEVRLK